MEWLTANWQDLIAIAGSVIVVSRLLVKLTPTPVDDTVLAKVVDVLKSLGLHIK